MNIIGLYQDIVLRLLDGRSIDIEKLRHLHYVLSVELDKAVVDNHPAEKIARNREAVMWLIEHL